MRENMGLYRGKRSDNGEWVEGNVDFNLSRTLVYIRTPREKYADVNMVYLSTVGQYIGRSDINGKRMFEGDIVKSANFVAVVGYSPVYAAFVLEIWYKGKADDVLLFNDELVGDLEIIGNIHDNPELLEVMK